MVAPSGAVDQPKHLTRRQKNLHRCKTIDQILGPQRSPIRTTPNKRRRVDPASFLAARSPYGLQGSKRYVSQPGSPTYVASEKTREAMANQLLAAGLAGVTITAQSNHGGARDTVHFATMRRAEGLEFHVVVVVAPQSDSGDIEQTMNQRKLMYAALTRAKRAAILIKVGKLD